MKNADSHIIHYAKGWYKKTDTVEDLKILYGKRNGVDPKFLGKGKIATLLLELCYKRHDSWNSYTFSDFVMSLSPDDRWKNYGYGTTDDYDFYLSVIHRCLSEMSILQIYAFKADGRKIAIVPLDEPDYSLLSKSENTIAFEKAKEKLDKKIKK